MADPLTKQQAELQNQMAGLEGNLDVLDRNLTLFGERLRHQIYRDVTIVGGLGLVLGGLTGWAAGRAGRKGRNR